MSRRVRSLWAEPRAPDPPRRVWHDWAIVAVVVPAAIVEGIVRNDVVWRPLAIVLCLALLPTVLWRRTHPLAMVVAAFGSFAVVGLVAVASGVEWEGLNTTAFVLLLPYALARWGSGREVVIGTAVLLGGAIVGGLDAANTVGEMVGGIIILLLAVLIGALVRFEVLSRIRERDRTKLREREQLARELHDTVAHHVSAIAIRAQAGRTLAATSPDAAVDALEIIEEEASRTLSEMRAMVGALRHGEEPDLTPQPGVADIERLASTAGNGPHIDVELAGDLAGLRPAVDAALYRLAQESVTNALRHARHATRIGVAVTGEGDAVRLTVRDDGAAGPAGEAGYGLVGMAERAKLLGGTFEAGPSRSRGWTVTAVLPRSSRR